MGVMLPFSNPQGPFFHSPSYLHDFSNIIESGLVTMSANFFRTLGCNSSEIQRYCSDFKILFSFFLSFFFPKVFRISMGIFKKQTKLV